ncbi:hypothetical protein ACWFQ8_27655 [Streptomyces sp. NPDC055254]
MEARTAASSTVFAAPPRVVSATDGRTAFAVTQSTPAITPAVVTEPWQSRTRTETSRPSLATPYVPPATTPTWVRGASGVGDT